MLVTLDTNVLFMALYSQKGASFQVLQEVRKGNLQLALSVPVFKEYEDVLTRKSSLAELQLEKNDVSLVLDALAFLGFPFDIHFLMRPNLRDEADNMFVDLAFTSSSDFLVTSNKRDFEILTDLKIDSFRIVTPKEFLIEWRRKND
jgi:putative PIN family toxin of toxin-antitoxin system